ncbi:MAG: hypothetical protein A2648_01465 [Candidatus Lloydbacteria bacterium RIFCSPHIGHO2_01_FULL_41_20]|uniref:Uncharacterized protein n=1 Tax=Candidatus Lloydbacteria bacterium RIFCSPHIGHO2_01_FULL_41_20 TaxID=1798657 RepID=A0A1G2CSX9_9BACT|nr:MAG: hypothetical protein A2648_01465 [Candidatus Lloydbacteria bacterium RIFCSPHIGHO2_01_FULL_41_20]
MDGELKELIKQNLELSKETNELLRKMRSTQRWGRIFRAFYWLIIIGLSLGVFYYLQGPLEQLIGTYQGLVSGVDKVQKTASSLPDSQTINSLLQKFQQ